MSCCLWIISGQYDQFRDASRCSVTVAWSINFGADVYVWILAGQLCSCYWSSRIIVFRIHHDRSVMLSLEYFNMMMVCFRLSVGYCYDLDYRLIDGIGISVSTVICLGINSVIKLVRCHRTGLFQCNHICLLWEGPNAMLLSCLSPVPPTREGYGRAVPWPGKQT